MDALHLNQEPTARLHGRFQFAAPVDHYLELLRRKPGALPGSLPLAQERVLGGLADEDDDVLPEALAASISRRSGSEIDALPNSPAVGRTLSK